jgi:uncharacterized protein
MSVPFVKVVRTDQNTYAYDVNTNSILRVSPAIGSILEDYEAWTNPAYRQKHVKIVNEEQYHQAIAFIETQQSKHGFFLPSGLASIQPNLTVSDIQNEDVHVCTHLILNITDSCNFRCRYCVYSGNYPTRRTHSGRTMSWHTAQKAIDLLVKHGRRLDERVTLGFYGGEPLLRFGFIQQAVEHAKQALNGHPYLFSITTNASLLTDEMTNYLVEHRFVVTLSLDGPKTIHDSNRRFQNGRGTFERVIAGIQKLHQIGGDDYFRDYVNISAVLTPPYELGRLQAFFAPFPTSVRIATLEFRDDLYANMTLHRARGLERLCDLLKRYCVSRDRKHQDFRLVGLSLPYELLGRELKRIHRRTPDSRLGETAKVLGLCFPGRVRGFVDCSGDIYVCERVEGNENMKIGTVNDGIDERKVRNILEAVGRLDFSQCQRCWLVRMCRLCFAHLVENGRYSDKKWRFSCTGSQDHYSTALKLYCEILEEDETALDFVDAAPAQYPIHDM